MVEQIALTESRPKTATFRSLRFLKLGLMLAAEVGKWGEVMKFAGIKPQGSGTPG